MTNFDFLKNDPQFDSFADVAVSAEKILNIDVEASVAELSPGHGICREMDVLGGRFPCQAISGYPGQPDECGRISEYCRSGSLEAHGFHQKAGKSCGA